MRKLFINISLLLALLFCNTNYATPGLLFNVSSAGSNGSTVLHISTVTPNHTYPQAGIKITSPGYSLSNAGSECTMASNGYCVFSVDKNTPKTISISGTGSPIKINLCLNGLGAMSCQQYQIEASSTPVSYVYAVNHSGNSVSLCNGYADGTLKNCDVTGSGFSGPYGMALNITRTGAFITNGGNNSIAMCGVDSDGNLTSCTNYTQTLMFSTPLGIALNPGSTTAYVTNYSSNTVRVCTVSGDTIIICADSGQTFTGNLEGIVIDPTNTYAYIVRNSSNAISKCTIEFGGVFSACVDSGATGVPFSNPELISLNTTGTMAYIANFGNGGFVSRCPIDVNTGNFGACVNAGNSGVAFNQPKQATLNEEGTLAYVSNAATNALLSCPVDGGGNFGECIDTGGNGFSNPWGVVIIAH